MNRSIARVILFISPTREVLLVNDYSQTDLICNLNADNPRLIAADTSATIQPAMSGTDSQFLVYPGATKRRRYKRFLICEALLDFRSEVIMRRALLTILLLTALCARATEPQPPPLLVANPEAFETLLHPNCSHCKIENLRRKDELRSDDRVLCWLQVQADGYINDGAIPIRFFLNKYRVLSDGWGVFVQDVDAGFARGFVPDGQPFRFHGWRNGVMVMKSQDGTLYSCLTGIAFDGPRKGSRLQPEPTILTDWGFWQNRYPDAVAYNMYNKYQPVELPNTPNDDSIKTRSQANSRLPADTMVLGVWDGTRARAYPMDMLEKAGVIHDLAEGKPRVIFWYGPTRTAAAFHQPWGTSGIKGDAGWIFKVDSIADAAPFTDQRTELHWDITGRAVNGGPHLIWMDSVQVKWFAWAAEYPQTSVFSE